LFADHEKIEVRDLAIRKITVDGDKAKLRIEVEIIVIDVKTGGPSADFGKMIRELQCERVGGDWKTWREAAAIENLAAALGALKTDVERSAFLTAEKDLVSENLVRELIRLGIRLRLQGKYPEALDKFHLAQKTAEQIGDRIGISNTLDEIGIV